MNRLLALGYALTVATLLAAIVVARGALPRLDGVTSLLVCQTIILALVPAAIMIFKGARRSNGNVRRYLGYGVAALDTLLGVGAMAAVAIIVFGSGRFA